MSHGSCNKASPSSKETNQTDALVSLIRVTRGEPPNYKTPETKSGGDGYIGIYIRGIIAKRDKRGGYSDAPVPVGRRRYVIPRLHIAHPAPARLMIASLGASLGNMLGKNSAQEEKQKRTLSLATIAGLTGAVYRNLAGWPRSKVARCISPSHAVPPSLFSSSVFTAPRPGE